MKIQAYRYFMHLAKGVKQVLNIEVPIYPLQHKLFLPEDEGEVLGCCHKIRDEQGDIVGYVITIDESYIEACCYGRQAAYSPYTKEKLLETICHEIAHLYYWSHDEQHKILTKELLEFTRFLLFAKNS